MSIIVTSFCRIGGQAVNNRVPGQVSIDIDQYKICSALMMGPTGYFAGLWLQAVSAFGGKAGALVSRALRLLNVWVDEIDFLVRREAEYGLKSLRSKQLRGLIEQVLIAGV
jgi:hypothetical protein